jgi:FAD/FMN-containing dehydrogenase
MCTGAVSGWRQFVEDVEAFQLVDAAGEVRRCSREENAELFALAIGGYGLFGVIVEVTLRLALRRTLRRVVRVIDIEEADPAARRRIDEGFLYGDFQFNIDPASPDFLTAGVFSAYCPVDGDPEPPASQKGIAREDWLRLLTLAHSDKGEGFRKYAQFYVGTDGQLYKSDTHQLAEYQEGYHAEVERALGSPVRGSEMITELYVPPGRLIEFLHCAAKMLVEQEASVIYGTIRLIMPDETTVLAWARERFACIIFNLHVDHTPAAIARAAGTFRALIDLAIRLEGSYYLTYHRWATAEQLAACYPCVREFLAAKRRLDPRGIFQSDWYRHYAPHFT